jgi:hypothetical protein
MEAFLFLLLAFMLTISLLAIFILFTYIFLKMAVNLRRAETGKK